MTKDIRLSRVAIYAAIIGSVLFYTSLLIFAVLGATNHVGPAVALFSQHPQWFSIGYILQACAFLAWAAVPIGLFERFHGVLPGWSLASGIMGTFAWLWLAQSDFAKAGSVRFLGDLYAHGESAVQTLADQLTQWTQFYTFGGVWEIAGNCLAYGLWVFTAGVVLRLTGHRKPGTFFTAIGCLDVVVAGGVGFFTAPLYIVWLAYLMDRAAVDTTNTNTPSISPPITTTSTSTPTTAAPPVDG